ncbi:gliding motility protein RemB [Mucilaginibacter sp. 21P]|uniref:gliding motility protein RemB n=1 Tax=Mucilaginibacter sp. 21P TaxID=2778902 RepID=UPI002107D2AA|nr:gliding motility protein RemB [Mucilaginibacter sp. 21P]
MQNNYLKLAGKSIAFCAGIMFTALTGKAQSVYLPQSYQFYQKFNADIYSKSSSMHTSLRPFLIDSTISNRYNQLMQMGVDSSRRSWFLRKVFNEHLLDIRNKDWTFYADYLQDNTIGHDFSETNKQPILFKPLGFGFTSRIGTNTRGFQLGGTVGKKFSFYTSGYENQAAFPAYYTDYVSKKGFVPGQAYDRNLSKSYRDFSYATAIISYTPIQQLNITLGQDKTFIGDGYRSILLSDFAANYPLLRLTANVGKFQYMMMWTYLQDLTLPKFDTFGSNRRKWGVFHYLDYNVNNSLSFGFFNGYIAPEADDQGNRRGFDVNFVNPILFSSSLGPSSQPGNALVGFTGKYKIFDKHAVYGQLLFDRTKSVDAANNNVKNTGGVQLGVRGADIFGVKDLNYLVEYDAVKPYTYSSPQVISAYTFYSQPLGDPLSANFREVVGLMNYTYKRFDFQGQLMYAKYGLDATAADNAGRDVTKPLVPTVNSTNIGQGLNTNLYYAEGTVSYLLNPKYNLRFELGALYRQEKNVQTDKKTTMLTFGIKSSFRNLYHDF